MTPSPGNLVAAAYLAQVRDIAPEELIGRDDELADIAAFCAGQEAYQWWQGSPWAGKTALASWVVLHPPAGVRAASFFITARLDDQSDSAAFSEAMIGQLAVIASEPPCPVVPAAARDGLRRHLIEVAAGRLRERGERLLLLVDGLDEDTGTRAGGVRASIASLLPRRPPDGVRVLVTSRHRPPLPADVPDDHPLRTCRKRILAASPLARSIAAAAEKELQLSLHTDGDREVIALIAAAGGGLTTAELAELTGRMRFEVQARLDTVLGRSLHSRTRYEAGHERAYLFAHETLRATADRVLHADLGPYRHRIHTWAGTYRDLGWPQAIPRYLLRPYGRMLAAAGDVRRLAAIAADSARHDRMLQLTGASAIVSEMVAAQSLLLGEAMPDLSALVLLAAERDRIDNLTSIIPAELPVIWARLGQSSRALGMARSIADPHFRARALAALVAGFGDDPALTPELVTEAEQAARDAPGWSLPRNLLNIAMALLASDPGRAGRLADEAEHAIGSSQSSLDDYGVDLVRVRAGAGLLDIAEDTANRIRKITERARALAEVAARLAGSDPARSARLADAAEETVRGHWAVLPTAFAGIATALASSHPERAARLADEAERSARNTASRTQLITGQDLISRELRGMEGPGREIGILREQARDLAEVATALAGFDRERAGLLARDAERAWRDGYAKAAAWDSEHDGFASEAEHCVWELDHVAIALAAAGMADQAEECAYALTGMGSEDDKARVAMKLADHHPAHAARLAERIEHIERPGTKSWRDADRDAALAEALMAAGQPDRALRAAAGSGWKQDLALTAIAAALAEKGRSGEALRVAQSIANPGTQALAVAAVARAVAAAQPDLAGRLARLARRQATPDPALCQDFWDEIHDDVRAGVLADAARALAASDPRQAAELASDAEACARSAMGGFDPGTRLVDVAGAYAATGDPERAELVAELAEITPLQARALAQAARALASTQPPQAARLFAKAEAVAETINDPGLRTATLVAVAEAQLPATAISTETGQRVRPLLAQALTTHHWRDILPMLGKIAPDATIALDDWMQTNHSTRRAL